MGKLNIKQYVEEEKKKLLKQTDYKKVKPKFDILLLGKNPASIKYVNNKIKFCKELEIDVRLHHYFKADESNRLSRYITKEMDEALTLKEILDKFVATKNAKMIQLPAPNAATIAADTIKYKYDVDGLSKYSKARLYNNKDCYLPCTAKGILEYMQHIDKNLAGKSVLIIGRSELVGRPLSHLLLKENMMVTVVHSKILREKIISIMKDYDYIVSAIGKPHYFKQDEIPEGVTFFDVGTTVVDDKLTGDLHITDEENVNFDYTSVPGGVGLLTVLSLMKNIIYGLEDDTVVDWNL